MVQDQLDQLSIERGEFGMPKPQGWPIERISGLMAGAFVLTSLALGRRLSSRWRIFTAFVGANLILDAVRGWCPMSVLLHRLGVASTAECPQRSILMRERSAPR